MTQLTNPTDTRRSTARRRDSLALWLLVAGGSLLLHLALFLGIRWFNLRVSVAQPDAVPIELIDDSPQSATIAPLPKPAAESPAPTASAQPERAEASPSAPSLEASPAERRSATPQNSPLPQREIPRTPIPTPPPVSTPTPTPTPSPSPVPSPSPTSSPAPDPSPNPSASNPGSSVNPAPPIEPGGDAGSSPNPDSPVPGGSPNPPNGESGDLSNVPVNRQENPSQSLSQITASLSARSAPVLIDGSARDVPEQSASPKQTTRSFASDLTGTVSGSASVGDTASCELNSEVDPYLVLGQPVSLRVYIDQQGKVLEATPTIAQENAYTRLAGCLLKQWEFTPAMSAGSPVESNDLVVDVTLTQN